MAIEFNTEGHALSNGEMVVYGYDSTTGEYQGSYTTQIIEGFGIPANSTLSVPTEKTGYAPVFKNGAWELVEDHRGETVYLKSNGTEETVKEIGPIDSALTTVKPTGEYVTWDEASNSWKEDSQAAQEALKQQAANALYSARAYVQNTYSILNEPTPDAWVSYLKSLTAIADGSATKSTTLPTAPAESA